MKRYFPVLYHSSSVFKKKIHLCDYSTSRRQPNRDQNSNPETILSWNCNGLHQRIEKNDWRDFCSYLEKGIVPDIICIQEVRLPAATVPGAKIGDHHKRNRGKIKGIGFKEIDEKMKVYQALNMPPLNLYHPVWSLSDSKYSGLLVLIKKTINVKGIRYNVFWDQDSQMHHPEGRIVLIEFEHFLLLITYSCYRGDTQASIQRRINWDNDMKQFVEICHDQLIHPNMNDQDIHCSLITQNSCSPYPYKPLIHCPSKPLIWIGDLNCALEDADLSHPQWFRQEYSSTKMHKLSSDDLGFPGCTNSERKRLLNIMHAGCLTDSYRYLYPNPPENIEGPYFTWRGLDSDKCVNSNCFYAKGMRLDTALIHQSILPLLKSFTIIGSTRYKDLFFGSDHSPILLHLLPFHSKSMSMTVLE